MFYYIKANKNRVKGFYTGSTVSKNKGDAYHYSSMLAARAAYRALQIAGRNIIPTSIGKSKS